MILSHLTYSIVYRKTIKNIKTFITRNGNNTDKQCTRKIEIITKSCQFGYTDTTISNSSEGNHKDNKQADEFKIISKFDRLRCIDTNNFNSSRRIYKDNQRAEKIKIILKSRPF